MKQTKKILAILLAVVMLFVLCACGGNTGNDGKETGSSEGKESEKSSEQASGNGSSISTEGSSGFNFGSVYDETTGQTGYSITGIGSCTDVDVVVPQGQKDYFGEINPYLWDDDSGFRGMEYAKTVTLPEGFLEIRSGFGYSSQLEKVTIPSTVRKIGYSGDSRIFEYCPAFKEIVYNGTIEQWNAIEKTANWSKGAEPFTIHCIDGDVL
ncbi:MAG: hypothetical protein J5874_06920 [Oscillospiraceae bacterium]|nr:hypothetical protein [Oscillospiraceae bacterium]